MANDRSVLRALSIISAAGTLGLISVWLARVVSGAVQFGNGFNFFAVALMVIIALPLVAYRFSKPVGQLLTVLVFAGMLVIML